MKAAACFKQGNAYQQQGKLDKARTAYDQGIGLYESLLADFPTVPAYRRKLVDLLTKTGRQPEVEALHRKDLDLRRELPVDNRELAAALAELTRTLLAQQKFTEAEPLARECLTLRKKLIPMAGRPSTPGACWVAACSGRRNSLKPSRCCSPAAKA